MKFTYAFFMTVLLNYYTLAQEKVALYDIIPNATKSKEHLGDENIPVLYRYEIADAKQAVLIIPGGGYGHVAINHEGHEVAKECNRHGLSAFVLYYRLPKDETMKVRKIGPLQDAQRAMQNIREQYAFERVGVIGFSAGGHLAATLSNHFDEAKIENPKHSSLRPDFSVLVYPVISMREGITHQGSKKNLIGEQAEEPELHYYSLDEQVSKKTPPTFLVHAQDDRAVVLENSTRYKAALDKVAVPNVLFEYPKGGHGFGLINKTDESKWSDLMFNWLKDLK